MSLSQDAIQKFLQDIQTREESHGISTAKFYLKSMAPCVSGDGICPTDFFGESGAETWAKELSESDSRFTFSADDMTITKAKCGCDDCKAGKTCPCKKEPEDQKGIIAEFDCVMTTPNVDRDGDIVVTKGLTFDERMPLLWHHMLVQPIGKFIKMIRHDEDVAIGRYAIIGTKMGEDVALLAEHGALRTSIGFIPKEIKPRETYKKAGETKVRNWHVQKAHVHENSMVSVPANQDVVITQFSRKSLKDDLVNSWAKGLFDARPAQGAGSDLEPIQDTQEDSVKTEKVAETELVDDAKLTDTKDLDLPSGVKVKDASDDTVTYAISSHKIIGDTIELGDVPSKMYIPDLDLLEGSWEWKQVQLARSLKNYLMREMDIHRDDSTMIAAMFDDYAIVGVDQYSPGRSYADRLSCYRIEWDEEAGIPMWSGEPVAVEVVAQVIEKMFKAFELPKLTLESAGGVVVEKMLSGDEKPEAIGRIAHAVESAAALASKDDLFELLT